MPKASGSFSGGAQLEAAGVRFRVWAPGHRNVAIVFADDALPDLPLEAEPDGHFSAMSADARAGMRYRFLLDGEGPWPDPYSRFQPEGPHGPSLIVDPAAYGWRDAQWPGITIEGQVIYELHVGAFTEEGTFDAAIRELPELRDLGVSCIEIMPVAEFPGRFNWGYDGVNLYAPYHGYGDHEALKRYVDAAHELGLGVILDVVYNHFGPDGNYLPCFSPHYFTDRYENDWGRAINFDGEGSGPVRALIIENAAYWIREFHLDGLRLDATQNVEDSASPHVLAQACQAAREAARPRTIILVAENEPQRALYLRSIEDGGFGLDAMWNDDFHHSSRVALTGRRDGYFHDHRGRPQELLSAVKHGFLFQGQQYTWQERPRGSPALDQPARAFIAFTQNHDQVANTFCGLRLDHLTSAGRNRAMTALLLLAPHTPMLFMGQEFGASAPFPFFADLRKELEAVVREGRREFMSQFEHYATPAAQARLFDPASPATFESAKLDFAERFSHAPTLALHRSLLRLRRADPVISRQDRERLDGAVLGDRAFLLRWLDAQWGDRLLLVNLGDDLELLPAPEPLIAPPVDARWKLAWSSDDPEFGGPGSLDPFERAGWLLPAESATLYETAVTPDAE